MKRFAVFAGDTYYPGGGLEDLQGSFSGLNEAVAFARGWLQANELSWAHVADLEDARIVWSARSQYVGDRNEIIIHKEKS